MTTTKSALIAVILDRSGSMDIIRDDTIGGFNAFLEEQKRLGGECHLSLAQFDTVYERVYEKLPIDQVPALTKDTFLPRGSTALLDAMGRALNDVESDLLALEKEGKKPEKIYFVVVTDGQENASRGEFTREQIFKMLEERRTNRSTGPNGETLPPRWNASWEFIFLAANQDAIAEGQSYGFTADASINYCAGSTSGAYGVVSNTISGSRATGESISFTNQQRSTAMGKPNYGSSM